MKKAIKVLEDKVNECQNMTKWFDTELVKHQHLTADQAEVQRLKIGQAEAIEVEKECKKAIKFLSK